MGKFNKSEVAAARAKWLEAKRQLEFAIEYPPFFYQEEDDWGFSLSMGTKEFENIRDDFMAELKRVNSLIPEMRENFDETRIDPDVFSNPFAEIEKKYSDELEEARLWMARFPTEPDKAVRKKLKG